LSTATGIVTARVSGSEAYRLGREEVVRAAVETIGPSPTVARLKEIGGITEVVRSQITRASTPGLDNNLGSPMFPLTPRSLLVREASSLRSRVQQLLSAHERSEKDEGPGSREKPSVHHTTKKKSARQLDREIAAALSGQSSETGSAFYDFLLERFPSGDVPWPWVQKILKGHGVPLPLMIGLGKEDAERYGIRQGKPADVHQLARFLGH
jgi:hypothetical protein